MASIIISISVWQRNIENKRKQWRKKIGISGGGGGGRSVAKTSKSAAKEISINGGIVSGGKRA
jgi:hypothetical protein